MCYLVLIILLLNSIINVESLNYNLNSSPVRIIAASLEGDGNTASIQYMITRRMRRVLEDELNYLPEEVDVMDPQIAKVVIERGLSRPMKGMPATWKRDVINNINSSNKNNKIFCFGILSKIRSIFNGFGKIISGDRNNSNMIVLPVLGVSTLAIYKSYPVLSIAVSDVINRYSNNFNNNHKRLDDNNNGNRNKGNDSINPKALGSVRRRGFKGL